MPKMNALSANYQKLKEMTPQTQIKILNHSIIYSGESSYMPTKEELDIASINATTSEPERI